MDSNTERPALLPESLSPSGAVFNSGRTHRYILWRRLDDNGSKPAIAFVGLNPSTADEIKNDPTVTRCMGYAKSWGYGTFYMLNIFGLRSTDPKGLNNSQEPIGPENDQAILEVAQKVERITLCWGNHGQHLGRGQRVLELLKEYPCCYLNRTKAGHPGHPLYLKASLQPLKWDAKWCKEAS